MDGHKHMTGIEGHDSELGEFKLNFRAVSAKGTLNQNYSVHGLLRSVELTKSPDEYGTSNSIVKSSIEVDIHPTFFSFFREFRNRYSRDILECSMLRRLSFGAFRTFYLSRERDYH